MTFFFSDIEGSTRLLHHLGDRYAHALADHRRLMRAAFAAHMGTEVDTQGDAFFVAFRDAREAVEAAAEAQRALAAHAWPDGTELRVRMGIHTGKPLTTDEGYIGIDVHHGARVMSAAHGGQILLSHATRQLLGEAPPPGTALRELGEHRLKDLCSRRPEATCSASASR